MSPQHEFYYSKDVTKKESEEGANDKFKEQQESFYELNKTVFIQQGQIEELNITVSTQQEFIDKLNLNRLSNCSNSYPTNDPNITSFYQDLINKTTEQEILQIAEATDCPAFKEGFFGFFGFFE